MARIVHGVRKTARANLERLPDISGRIITYAGAPENTVEVTERTTSEPTVAAGAQASVGGYSGVVEQQVATCMPQLKKDGAVVWELVTTLAIDVA